ncbi:MAG: metalloregulator ArsR/SmtB family transcription factor [Archaeoglobales archaeon]|nr:metalloregulator ArsR/SmtB family transcription factor [Archaeoglobales archaeon]
MDILEVIGNESRRKILELLSKKPCYVSEISYCLKMAPKVVLEHLEKLESAGIVKSLEDGKRRYYYIAKNLHIDVTISPHRFEVRIVGEHNGDPAEALRKIESKFETLNESRDFYTALKTVEEIDSYFSAMHNFISIKLNELMERMMEEVEKIASDDFERLVILAIAKGLRRTTEIAEFFRIPYREVERILESLWQRGIVKRERLNGEDFWVVEVRL